MVRITQLKVPITYEAENLRALAAAYLKMDEKKIESCELVRESLDARKKPELFFSLVVDVKLSEGKRAEEKLLSQRRLAGKVIPAPSPYKFAYANFFSSEEKSFKRPVIVGFGPAGMMAGYYLAKAGYRPFILERGCDADKRSKLVETFWEKGELNPLSNVQFGEGGAGTFSDGKLNTLIKDKEGRCKEILKLFVSMGAPEDILYQQKPHIGTDFLIGMVKNIREAIIKMGGEVLFETKMTKLLTEGGKVTGIEAEGPEGIRSFETDTLILAIGHSARDTFRMLYDGGIEMEAKAFAVGFRVIHPQNLINESQYGKQPESILKKLGAANYKLTAKTSMGRGVYSFCMCPGGYVVNSSSEPGQTVVNGMSYHDREGKFANSAIIVSVTPEDFEDTASPLSGIAFQEKLEKKAYEASGGRIPVEPFGEFRKAVTGIQSPGESESWDLSMALTDAVKGAWETALIHEIMPQDINRAFVEGMEQFGKVIPGFDADNVPLCGIESRTSSPVRIPREEDGQAKITGLYPIGEGAGYAGGIMSAAIDGLRVAEKICGGNAK